MARRSANTTFTINTNGTITVWSHLRSDFIDTDIFRPDTMIVVGAPTDKAYEALGQPKPHLDDWGIWRNQDGSYFHPRWRPAA